MPKKPQTKEPHQIGISLYQVPDHFFSSSNGKESVRWRLPYAKIDNLSFGYKAEQLETNHNLSVRGGKCNTSKHNDKITIGEAQTLPHTLLIFWFLMLGVSDKNLKWEETFFKSL